MSLQTILADYSAYTSVCASSWHLPFSQCAEEYDRYQSILFQSTYDLANFATVCEGAVCADIFKLVQKIDYSRVDMVFSNLLQNDRIDPETQKEAFAYVKSDSNLLKMTGGDLNVLQYCREDLSMETAEFLERRRGPRGWGPINRREVEGNGYWSKEPKKFSRDVSYYEQLFSGLGAEKDEESMAAALEKTTANNREQWLCYAARTHFASDGTVVSRSEPIFDEEELHPVEGRDWNPQNWGLPAKILTAFGFFNFIAGLR